jgi:hypothetical protein
LNDVIIHEIPTAHFRIKTAQKQFKFEIIPDDKLHYYSVNNIISCS